ncbi:MAG: gamma-glutamyltransferase, partial [Dehalococcoidia bacterium]|nr:gamma-glutamyltransferase [Dehalococcoidia bacterium]
MPSRVDRSEPPAKAPAYATHRADIDAPFRGPTYGARSVIATDHPAASLAAINALQRGGNAVDATIAAAAVNVVVKPQRTHLGGDAFALIWQRRTGAVECLNAGGRAPHRATPEQFGDRIPNHGPRASTVPGMVDSLVELHERHGSLPLPELLEPAIELADRGFPVSTRLAVSMQTLARADFPDDTTRQVFLAGAGRPYREGELFRQPDLAETLRRIATDGRAGFYGGETGAAISEAMSAGGGLIDEEDLAEPTALWHEPLSIAYRGCTVYEQALPSQGIILLEALNIVEQFPLAGWGPGSAEAAHVMIEATRQAFADARRYAADPLVEQVPVDRLLSKEHARARAAEIDVHRTKQ